MVLQDSHLKSHKAPSSHSGQLNQKDDVSSCRPVVAIDVLRLLVLLKQNVPGTRNQVSTAVTAVTLQDQKTFSGRRLVEVLSANRRKLKASTHISSETGTAAHQPDTRHQLLRPAHVLYAFAELLFCIEGLKSVKNHEAGVVMQSLSQGADICS